MRRIRSLLWVLALLACGEAADRGAEPADDVVLGLIASFDTNRPDVDGAILAVDEINAAGGIAVAGGMKKVRLIVEDGESQPETAVSKALKLINRDGAVALLGLPRSFNAIPVAKIAEQYGIPMISTMSTNPETTAGKRYVFRLAFLDSFQGKVLANFAFDDLGARRVAILIDAVGPYNTYLAEVFSQAFRDRGGELVAFETFTADDLEILDQLQAINASGAEVLFMPNTLAFVKLHVPAARRSGFDGILLGGDSWSHGIEATDQPEFRGTYFSDLWAPGNADDKTRAFIDSYSRAYGRAPTASTAVTYDAVTLVARVIGAVGTEPDSIRAGLASLSGFQGVSGTIEYRGSGDPARSVFIRGFDEDGRIRLVKEVRP